MESVIYDAEDKEKTGMDELKYSGVFLCGDLLCTA